MDLWKPLWLSTVAALAMACMAAAHGGGAPAAPLASVTIWNYVGEPILVHCHNQFTGLEQQDVPHDTDYVFTFYQNAEGTTLYSCSFVWGLNETQEFPVWKGRRSRLISPGRTAVLACSSVCTKSPRQGSSLLILLWVMAISPTGS